MKEENREERKRETPSGDFFPSTLCSSLGISPDDAIHWRWAMWQRCASDIDFRVRVLAQCKRSIEFWIDYFCWTFDPRHDYPVQPFFLYPFQREALARIQHNIHQGKDILIEKSRDMGVSWLILLTFQYEWLFRSGSQFLLGSRKQSSVDTKGDLSTLFEKLRFNLTRLPLWMLPQGFNPQQHDTLMKLQNPANQSGIMGESSNAQFGRGGRYKAMLMDEFPVWPQDEAAYASAGQSTPCRILVGTPHGKQNTFAQVRFGETENDLTASPKESGTDILTLHWRLHPEKDDTWYQRQCLRMSPSEIARELDINYSLSVENRVFPQFGEEHIVKNLETLPNNRLIRVWDFGYHCPCCLFFQIEKVREHEQVRVLKEVVGEKTTLKTFAQMVLDITQRDFPDLDVEDLCDPAGAQKTDKSEYTSVDILNSLGIFPFYQRSRILQGLEMLRLKLLPLEHPLQENLSETEDALVKPTPGLVVDSCCHHLIEAFQGGYRYISDQQELPYEEHPFEDVMDCLRYGVVAKCNIQGGHFKRPRLRVRRGQSRYTGY